MLRLFKRVHPLMLISVPVVCIGVSLQLWHSTQFWMGRLNLFAAIVYTGRVASTYLDSGFWSVYFAPNLAFIDEIPVPYSHHPPLMFILTGVFYKILGISIFTTNLLPIIIYGCSLWFVFRLVCYLDDSVTAVTAIALVVALPISQRYALVNAYEPGVILSILGMTFYYLRYLDLERFRDFGFLLFFVVFGLLYGWGAYLFVPFLFAHSIAKRKSVDARMLVIGLMPLFLFAGVNFLYHVASPCIECNPIDYYSRYRPDVIAPLKKWWNFQLQHQEAYFGWATMIFAWLAVLLSGFFRNSRRTFWILVYAIVGVAYLLIFRGHAINHEFFHLLFVVPLVWAMASVIRGLPQPVSVVCLISLLVGASVLNFRLLESTTPPERIFFKEWRALKNQTNSSKEFYFHGRKNFVVTQMSFEEFKSNLANGPMGDYLRRVGDIFIFVFKNEFARLYPDKYDMSEVRKINRFLLEEARQDVNQGSYFVYRYKQVDGKSE